MVYSYKLKPGSDKQIYDAISDMTISMQACDHLKMPKLISTTWPVKMDKDEEKVYKSLKNDLVLDLQGQEITASSAATLCMKLTQLSSGAIYSDDGGVVKVYDRKLDALEDIIEASCGKSLLVAYYFKHDLIRIEERSRLVLFILKVVVWV